MSARYWLLLAAALATVSCTLAPGLDLPSAGTGGTTAGSGGGGFNLGSGGSPAEPNPTVGVTGGAPSGGAPSTAVEAGTSTGAAPDGGAGGAGGAEVE